MPIGDDDTVDQQVCSLKHSFRYATVLSDKVVAAMVSSTEASEWDCSLCADSSEGEGSEESGDSRVVYEEDSGDSSNRNRYSSMGGSGTWSSGYGSRDASDVDM